MISYVNMSALTPLASNHNQTTVHSQNEYDSSLSLVFDFITNNSSNAPSEDSSSQSIDEDSSYIDKDFFSSMRLYNKKVVAIINKRKFNKPSDEHSAPHIEFLSPPPELMFA